MLTPECLKRAILNQKYIYIYKSIYIYIYIISSLQSIPTEVNSKGLISWTVWQCELATSASVLFPESCFVFSTGEPLPGLPWVPGAALSSGTATQ